MFKELIKYTGKPALYAKGTANFWDDQHMSKQLLKAHLNPNWDAASRKPATIDKTVAWVNDNYLTAGSRVLDLGCGPGLYAERLARLGHSVTGVDFSKRSIEYARESSQEQGLAIEYVYKNYLEIDYHEQFDLVLLVYCDLGALVDVDRDLLLQKIHAAIKPGGVFIFDVFTDDFSATVVEKQSWELTDDGFWAEGAHCVLEQSFHYPEEKVLLSQSILMRADGTHDLYRIYDHYYGEADLTKVLNASGFTGHRFFYDVIGETDFASQKVVFTATHK
ncbi:MAG: type 11 methyltransferase [Bacillota bacterium]|nr:MAG: type 11 methyltransferase [Bacillota bacterium]MBS3949315.1 methyltransferase domain-containing protein [Peptococcaceae bacterium]